ncbi:MAG: tRNA 2-thiouridine(34) synthase MnmA [Halobacteriovoraceae bacterium]|nr:tRNA 2-thiouridine(34) synthase MnmA [Halobacteriovoraceae bacterium]
MKPLSQQLLTKAGLNLGSSERSQNAQTTVVVGMSGGVDSSVACLLLKEQGYKVIAMFMKNWEEKDENGVCQSVKEYRDVVNVCEKLDIPYYSVEFVKEYQEQVFSHFIKEYKEGHTPNPDILCNREIKFKVFFNKARELGADFLATGHYCQTQKINNRFQLVKGVDQGKDQSYFLYTIKTEILEHVLFPIGHLEKHEVRDIAKAYGLSTAGKKDSTGICFIGERNFKNFLSNYISPSNGPFKTLDGTIVGSHSGAHFYTLGQRKGLGLGGPGAPWFVIKKDMRENTVYVERGERHPALYSDDLVATDITWVDPENPPEFPLSCKAKIRYRQKDQDCTITLDSTGKLNTTFAIPQRSITPRQSLVLYREVEGLQVCLGGAMIESAGLDYDCQNKILPKIVSL